MDIILGEYKNINSVNKDNSFKIELNSKTNSFQENEYFFNKKSIDVFDEERTNYQIYRAYGSIEYLSLLNGLNSNYSSYDDFFNRNSTNNKYTIYNSFNFYLVTPSSNNIINGSEFIRQFSVIAKPTDISVQNMGFYRNVFNDDIYYYQCNIDINIIDKYQTFVNSNNKTTNIPIDEIYLYVQYIPKGNEILQGITWSNDDEILINITGSSYDYGDIIYGDTVLLDSMNYVYEISKTQKYIISQIISGQTIQHEYNPFIPIKLRYFDSVLKSVNINETSYDNVNKIKPFAYTPDNIMYYWREIIDDYESKNDNNYNIPFINGRKYSFNKLLLSIKPNIEHSNTYNLFNNMVFTSSDVYSSPISDLSNIGKSCQF